ncbi:MAG TPA: branched-chain amino acid ABC transporter permease [Tepidisphaeraceae bacterium]|nr:branched-chain amino acid ABC transporter permease [Tepidisphaeraceae bacterium]
MAEFLQQLVNGLSLGAIYALIAVGYTMVYGVLRLINFAHGEVFMVGAMVAWYTATRWLNLPLAEGPSKTAVWITVGVFALGAVALLVFSRRRLAQLPWVVLLLGLAGALAWGQMYHPGPTAVWFAFLTLLAASMAASALLGFLIEFLAYRPLRGQPRINALITAIGVSLFLQYAGQTIFFGPDPKTLPDRVKPALIPGTKEKPEVLLPWAHRTVLRFGVAGDVAAPPADATRVQLEGSRFMIVWTTPATQATTAPATGPSTAPAAAVPTTGPAVAVAASAAPVRHEIYIDALMVLILLLTLALMVALRRIVMKTRTGLGLRAVSHRFDTAALMGVNVNRAISFTFVLGSALAGAAGMLYATAYPQSIQPMMGLTLGLAAFVSAVVGGIGNIPGAVAGGFLIGMVQTLVAGYLPSGSLYNNAIAYVILILVLLVRPAGLFGRNVAEKV